MNRHVYWQMAAITLFVVLAVIVFGLTLSCWLAPSTYAQAPGYTRYVVLDSGISVISGGGQNYYVSGGYVDLPSGAEWVTPLLTRGVIQPLYATFQVNGLRAVAQAAIEISDDSVITPTGVYQPLTASAACGTASIAAMAAGTVVAFQNVSTNTITLTDTGTLLLSGNAALGQYDTLVLLSDGTNWIQLAKADN